MNRLFDLNKLASRPFTDQEIGMACKSLLDRGLTPIKVREVLGLGQEELDKYLAAAEAPTH